MNKWTKSRDIHNCRAALMGVQAREGVSGFDGEARLAGLLRIRRGENTLGPRVVNSEDIAVRTHVVTQAELALATSVAERRPEAIVSPFTCSRVIHFTRLPSKSDMDSHGFTWPAPYSLIWSMIPPRPGSNPDQGIAQEVAHGHR